MDKSIESTFNVAVYGTLKEGFSNHRLMAGGTKLGIVVISGYDMYSLGGFPAILAGKGQILAEVWEMKSASLAHLDLLEGYRERDPDSSLYLRKTIKTELGDAFIYILNREEYARSRPLIPDGNWTNKLRY